MTPSSTSFHASSVLIVPPSHFRRRFVMAPSGRFEPAMQTAMKTFKDAADLSSGLSASRARELLNYLGPNKIAFNPDTYTESIAKELCSPFYLYQLMVYMYWNWFGCVPSPRPIPRRRQPSPTWRAAAWLLLEGASRSGRNVGALLIFPQLLRFRLRHRLPSPGQPLHHSAAADVCCQPAFGIDLPSHLLANRSRVPSRMRAG